MEPIIGDLSDLFPDVITMESGTYNEYGRFTGSGVVQQIPCFIQGAAKEFIGRPGSPVNMGVSAILAGCYGATTRHHYTLPERFSPRSPECIAVQTQPDENGPHHEIVHFSTTARA